MSYATCVPDDVGRGDVDVARAVRSAAQSTGQNPPPARALGRKNLAADRRHGHRAGREIRTTIRTGAASTAPIYRRCEWCKSVRCEAV